MAVEKKKAKKKTVSAEAFDVCVKAVPLKGDPTGEWKRVTVTDTQAFHDTMWKYVQTLVPSTHKVVAISYTLEYDGKPGDFGY